MSPRSIAPGSARAALVLVTTAGLLAGPATPASAGTVPLRAGAWDCFEHGVGPEFGWSVGLPWPASPVYWPGATSGPGAGYLLSGCDAPETYVARSASADGSAQVEGLRFTESGRSEADQLATAPEVGDSGTARTDAARVVLDLGDVTIEATGVVQQATYRCEVVGGLPVSSSRGQVGTLAITTRQQVGGVTVATTARFGPITTAVRIPVEGHGYLMVNGRSEETGNRTYGDHDPHGWVEQAALKVVPTDVGGAGAIPGLVSAVVYYPEGNPCAAP